MFKYWNKATNVVVGHVSEVFEDIASPWTGHGEMRVAIKNLQIVQLATDNTDSTTHIWKTNNSLAIKSCHLMALLLKTIMALLRQNMIYFG